MAEYKRIDDILGELMDREQIHGLVQPKVPKAAKYRRESNHDKKKRPDLRVGARLIWPIRLCRKRVTSIAGYAMGVVLDWSTSRSRWWSRSEAIVQVTKVSNPEIEEHAGVGHLRAIDIGGWRESPLFVPEEADPKDFGF